MADNRLKPRERKLLYIAPLIIGTMILAVLIVIFVVLPAGQPPPMVKSPPPGVPYVPRRAAAAITAPLPALTRKDLIEASRQAAARYAAGETAAGTDVLTGRRFSVRIPFACNGIQNAPAAQIALSLDAQNQSITLAARPGDWTSLPMLQAAPDAQAIDTASGFWIPRPWNSSESCPAPRAYPVPVTPTSATAQTLGLVQMSGDSDSRVGQRSAHAYEFTRKIASGDAAVLGHSYRLVLEGRITGFADGQAQRCWAESADHRPLCLYGVSFDHVAFEDAETGKVLANWTD
jgi:hypothetical protein